LQCEHKLSQEHVAPAVTMLRVKVLHPGETKKNEEDANQDDDGLKDSVSHPESEWGLWNHLEAKA
jgi:hypothetical protein